jgi:hypothetical protein
MPSRSPRFAVFISFAVVVVSIATAATGFLAARSSIEASDLEQQIVQIAARQQQQKLSISGEVAGDLRLQPRLQEHDLLARLLERDAERAGDETRLGRSLRDRAIAERSAARALRRHVRYVGSGGLHALQEDETARPAETRHRAGAAQDETVGLIAWTALFALALVFLTLARVGPEGARAGLAACGVLAAVMALTLVVLGQPLHA